MRNAKIVGFVNQKGGVGKSTLTMLVATALAKAPYNLKVAIVDCDAQTSLQDQRKMDEFRLTRKLSAAKAEEHLKKTKNGEGYSDEELQKTIATFTPIIREKIAEDYSLAFPYPLIYADVNEKEQVIRTIIELKGTGKYDLIFVDMPGSASEKGIGTILSVISHAFVPVESGNFDVTSTNKFIVKTLKNIKFVKENEYNSPFNITVLFNKLEETNKYKDVIDGFYGKYEGDQDINIIDEEYGLPRSVFYKDNGNTYESLLQVKARTKTNKKMQERFKDLLKEIMKELELKK